MFIIFFKFFGLKKKKKKNSLDRKHRISRLFKISVASTNKSRKFVGLMILSVRS